jgi:hypothetical protein
LLNKLESSLSAAMAQLIYAVVQLASKVLLNTRPPPEWAVTISEKPEDDGEEDAAEAALDEDIDGLAGEEAPTELDVDINVGLDPATEADPANGVARAPQPMKVG